MVLKLVKCIRAFVAVLCLSSCLTACSSPDALKTANSANQGTAAEPSASQSSADTDFGADGSHMASSLKALAEQMLSDDDAVKANANSRDTAMSSQQRAIIAHAAKNNGKMSRSEYEQAWMNFRSCIMNRGWTDPKPPAYGGFYSVPSMNIEGLNDEQAKKLDKDWLYCSSYELVNADTLYRTQESNPELSTDFHQLVVNCLITKKVVPTSYSKDQFSKDFSNEPLPQYFSTAEAQECFTLYQIGIANVSEKESYWKPLG
ncbi:hypothetical protein [Bifidobacterium apri]|uniref:Lipoprotein n=1 Tax=Bifidobacterium apri TaxID=1769423 RepID=A0A6A2VDI3_9BIFI|nr:hypothetical protein [Bifidobacterium apri]KAB8295712.1 hypothetical protein DSM100238_1576 [Bifidobacterium apri]